MNQHAKARVHGRVRTGGFGRNCDLFTDTGESTAHITPAFQLTGFTEFKCSSHFIFMLLLFILAPSYKKYYLSSAPKSLRSALMMRVIVASIALSLRVFSGSWSVMEMA